MTNINTNQSDPWDIAETEQPRGYEFYGQVHADANFIFFPGNGAKPIPFDPGIHPNNKRVTEVEFRIIPIPEQDVDWDESLKILTFSKEWHEIVKPSIDALGLDKLREINNKWVRVAKVPGFRKRLDKDTGEDTGEFWSTYQFKELYKDERACREAYTGESVNDDIPFAGKKPDDDQNKKAAMTFINIWVTKAASVLQDRKAIEEEVKGEMENAPLINHYFTIDSPEVQEAIDKAMAKENARP
jgi:hypothetical protein